MKPKKNQFNIKVVRLAFASFLALASPLSGQEINFNLLPSLGQVTKYRLEITQDLLSTNKNVEPVHQEQKFIFAQKTLEIRKNGDRVISIVFIHDKQTTKSKLLVSKNGRVTVLEGEQNNALDNFFFNAPDSVSVGEGWKRKQKVKLPNGQTLKIESTYKLAEVSSEEALINVQTSPAQLSNISPQFSKLIFSSNGTIRYDYKNAEMIETKFYGRFEVEDSNGQTFNVNSIIKIVRFKK